MATRDPMTKTEYAYAEIRRRIIHGEVTAGTRLRLRQLADELNLSEMPIREALRLLQRDGLISFESHRGATVTDVSAEQVIEQISVRMWLEVLATEEAAGKHTSKALAAMGTALDRADVASKADNWTRFTRENRTFHELIEEPASEFLRGLIAAEWDRVWQARRQFSLFVMRPERMQEAQAEHRRLYDCLRAGDGDGAATAMNEHRRHTLDAWRQAFGAAA